MTLAGPDAAEVLPAARRLEHLRWMLRSRLLEEHLRNLYRQGRITGGVYLGLGHEAISSALAMALRPGDVYAPLIRDTAGRLAFGEPILNCLRTYLGKRTGTMRGRDGNIHRGDPSIGMLPMISHLGAMVPVVVGAMLARRLAGGLTGSDLPVGAVCLGEGAMATGASHEGINAACVERLPMVILVVNNQFSYSTGNDRSFACRDLADRAVGYGARAWTCDGTQADASLGTLAAAVAAARAGGGVQLVVATTLRMCGHGEHDDASYIPADIRARFVDPVTATEQRLLADGLLNPATLAQLRTACQAEIDAAQAKVEAEPDADVAGDDWQSYRSAWARDAGLAQVGSHHHPTRKATEA